MTGNTMKVSLLTGCVDPHYQLDLLSGLIAQCIEVDFIGNDVMQKAEIVTHKNVNFYNFRGSQDSSVASFVKVARILKYYYSIIRYAATTDSKVFHIQWVNKFYLFDRTVLNMYYKALGKKLVHTAHNVNMGTRDKNDSFLNRFALKFMYTIVDHIIVHTQQMKQELMQSFKIQEKKISVINFGINNTVISTDISPDQARKKLQVRTDEKVMLFFGNIAPYKGLKYLILALTILIEKQQDIKLIIAGRIKKNTEKYWKQVKDIIKKYALDEYIQMNIGFIPDEDIEVYCKAADVMLLPYTYIYQSGILFLSYRFGLPVIASNIGSFGEDIVESKTGFICKPEDPVDLAEKIDCYFESDLYKNLAIEREKLIAYAYDKYSWEKIGQKTAAVYKDLLRDDL